MVKPAGPGVYSATYSNIPVYEFQFGEGLKEHVMRRRGDDWINATHILKAAGFDKPARTRILEREVQKETHEKVQGGYGKYQGTWVPLEQGEALAQRNNVYEKLRTIFEFTPGNVSPPPAPKHTTAKPKIPKRPAVPKFNSKPMAAPKRADDDYDNISAQLNDDESMADDMTVASASFMGDDDRYEMSQPPTGHRKRKNEEREQSALERAHTLYSDELLDYFMLGGSTSGAPKPEPPINFNPDWIMDSDGHSPLHWAAAMGDIDLIRELKRFGADLIARNARGETPLMRAVLFVNCMEKQTMPVVVKELIETVDSVDQFGSTVLHHTTAITMATNKHTVARYYLDVIINKLQEVYDSDRVQGIMDATDIDGNTAVHLAAKHRARKCVRSLIGRGANTNIANNEGITAEAIIREMNENRKHDRHPQASSSPYGPDPRIFDQMPTEPRITSHHISEAAMSIQSKVAPQMLEKFEALAGSFDQELNAKDLLETDARRVLTTTMNESKALNLQLRDLGYQRETAEEKERGEQQLAVATKQFEALVEQQQEIQLLAQIQLEESKMNGHISTDDDDNLAERIMLAKMVEAEQQKRRQLMGRLTEARSLAGGGDQIATYRHILTEAIGAEGVSTFEADPEYFLAHMNDENYSRQNESQDA